MATRHGSHFTYQDYLLLPDELRCEIMAGELVMTPAPGERHQAVARNIQFLLWGHVRQCRLGLVYSAPFDVILSEEDVVQPDIVFVAAEHRDRVRPEGLRGAPDLVVEIASPATVDRDRGPKRELYHRHGVREYWLVDPDGQAVEVLARGADGFVLAGTFQPGDSLASPLLPGFTPDVAAFFAE